MTWLEDDSDAYWQPLSPPNLVPIGDSRLYITPLMEPVEPTDCANWETSLLCSGRVWENDFIDLGLDFAANGCETCVLAEPTLFWVGFPPIWFCERSSVCREPPPEPPPYDPPPFTIFEPWNSALPSGCVYRVYGRIADVAYDFGENPIQGGSNCPLAAYLFYTWSARGWFHSGVSELLGTLTYYVGVERLVQLLSRDKQTGETIVNAQYSYTVGATVREGCDPIYIPEGNIVYHLVPDPRFNDLCDPVPLPPPPPPPRPDPPMNCCCDNPENDDLLRLIAYRLGVQDYPVTVPASLIASPQTDSATQQTESLTQLQAWFVKQVDALSGQFPIEVEIEDIDPTTQGNQTRKIELPNIAETLAEIYGLSVRSSVNSDISINFLMRLAAEVIATKNAAVVAQDYSKANAQFLGYKGNPKNRRLNYAFNPEQLDNLEGILQECTKTVIGWGCDDDETVVDFLQKIVFASGIIKAVFMRKRDQIEDVISQIQNLTTAAGGEDNWQTFVNALNDPASGFNRNSPIHPEVTDYSQSNGQAPPPTT